MKNSLFTGSRIAAAVTLMLTSTLATAETAVVRFNGAVTDYFSPAQYQDLGFTVIGQTFTLELVIPEFERYASRDNRFTGTVALDGTNGIGMSLNSEFLQTLEGTRGRIVNPNYDPNDPSKGPEIIRVAGVTPGAPLGDAFLTFADGKLVGFDYSVGRDVLQSYDAFIRDLQVVGFGLGEISLSLNGFTLTSERQPPSGNAYDPYNGWIVTEFMQFSPNSYTASVTGISTVPVPAALPMLLGGLATLGGMARRRAPPLGGFLLHELRSAQALKKLVIPAQAGIQSGATSGTTVFVRSCVPRASERRTSHRDFAPGRLPVRA